MRSRMALTIGQVDEYTSLMAEVRHDGSHWKVFVALASRDNLNQNVYEQEFRKVMEKLRRVQEPLR